MSNDKGIPNLYDLIGVPFLDKGRDQKRGLDCWGLVLEVQRRIGNAVPDYGVPSCYDSAACDAWHRSVSVGGDWQEVSEPSPGDVVAMETNPNMPGVIDHYGVFIGGGRFIHAIQKHEVSAPKLRLASMFGKVRGFYRWAGK